MIDDGNLSFHRAMCKDRNCPTCLGAVVGTLESFQRSMEKCQAQLMADGGSYYPRRKRAWYDEPDWFDRLTKELAQ